MIDHDNVVKYAQDRAVPFTNYASLCATKEVRDLINSEIEKVNKNFARVETIKRFALIDQLLTAEDDELTPTMKLKRKYVKRKIQDIDRRDVRRTQLKRTRQSKALGGVSMKANLWTSCIFATLLASTVANAQAPVWKTQGVTKDEIVLGMHADLSGVAATFSVGVVNAFRMRIDEVNAAGGIHGRKLKLVVEDTAIRFQRPFRPRTNSSIAIMFSR
jgi:Long-chain acyl-CoA synthetases (AMP-forming)